MESFTLQSNLSHDPSMARETRAVQGFAVTETNSGLEAKTQDYQLRNGSECGCPGCHRIFASEDAFDKHRVGDYSDGRKCSENPAHQCLELDSRGRWRRSRQQCKRVSS